MTLHGSVLEDAIPSTAKHGTARGFPLKEVLELIIPKQHMKQDWAGICTGAVPELWRTNTAGPAIHFRDHDANKF